MSNAFGSNVGGHTGYTNRIYVKLARGSTRSYVCGDRSVPDISIGYIKKHLSLVPGGSSLSPSGALPSAVGITGRSPGRGYRAGKA